MNEQQQILAVELLGDSIGYGNLMSLASALWRSNLIASGIPAEGAFVPTCEPFIKKGYHDKRSTEMYDRMIAEYKSKKP